MTIHIVDPDATDPQAPLCGHPSPLIISRRVHASDCRACLDVRVAAALAAGRRHCPWCGNDMEGRRPHVRFCNRDCQTAHLRTHGPTGYRRDGDTVDRVSVALPPGTIARIAAVADTEPVPEWIARAVLDQLGPA